MYSRNGHYFNLCRICASENPVKAIVKNRSEIPANVFMTWKTLDFPPHMKQNVDRLILENPELNIRVFDDDMCREFIANHFPFPVLDAYDTLIPGAYKADLWRLCVLYIHGGIYLDIKYGCVSGFKLEQLLYKEHLVLDRPEYWKSVDDYGIYNAVMVCLPKTDFLRKCIDGVLWNVQNKIYGHNAMYPTGPGLLGDIHKSMELASSYLDLDMAMMLNGIDKYGAMFAVIYQNKIILETYEEYREESGTNGPNYIHHFRSGNIYRLTPKTQNDNMYNSIIQKRTQPQKVSNTFNMIIPAKVYLTWESTRMPIKMYKNMEKMIQTNMDMMFELYTDEMCESFIETHYSAEVLNAYKCLVPGAYKADLWRYCILYIYGGIYMDIKLNPHITLSSLLEKEHFVIDIPTHHRETADAYGLYNGLMVCKAGNPILKAAIDAVVKNVKSRFYGVSTLCPTGPNLLGKVYAEMNGDSNAIDMGLCINGNVGVAETKIMYNGKPAFTYYNQYREEQKMSNKPHYSQLYLKRAIYNDSIDI